LHFYKVRSIQNPTMVQLQKIQIGTRIILQEVKNNFRILQVPGTVQILNGTSSMLRVRQNKHSMIMRPDNVGQTVNMQGLNTKPICAQHIICKVKIT